VADSIGWATLFFGARSQAVAKGDSSLSVDEVELWVMVDRVVLGFL
jgi:hypothetical protein